MRLVFVGANDKLTIPGPAFGKNANKIVEFLPMGALVIIKTKPADPEKDLFGSKVSFSLKLNTETRISCAGLTPYVETGSAITE